MFSVQFFKTLPDALYSGRENQEGLLSISSQPDFTSSKIPWRLLSRFCEVLKSTRKQYKYVFCRFRQSFYHQVQRKYPYIVYCFQEDSSLHI